MFDVMSAPFNSARLAAELWAMLDDRGDLFAVLTDAERTSLVRAAYMLRSPPRALRVRQRQPKPATRRKNADRWRKHWQRKAEAFAPNGGGPPR